MSLNLNRVTLAGNLTRDPEVRFLANQQAVANFGVAINRKFKDSAGVLVEEVTFVDIECWGRTAELVGQYCTKGRPLYVEGRLKLDRWETTAGEKRQRLKVVADSIQFLGSKPAGPSAAPADAPAAGAMPAADAANDEPPF